MPQNDLIVGLDFSSVTGACASAVIDINNRLLGGKAVAKKPFRMAAKDGVGEIFIFDEIGEGFFSDGITPKSFAADLKALGAVRTLNVFINSPGGAVFDGVAIFNQLKRHPARKNVFIDGIAASIASVIAMAGDEINIAANGFIMIHEPFTMAFGTAADLRKTADQLEKINDTIINTYAARTGTPENVIGDLMVAQTWMNAEEAVELGFADNITDEVAVAARFDLTQFQNVPEEASAKLDLAKNPPKIGFAHGDGSPGFIEPEPEGTVATVELVAIEDDAAAAPRPPSLAVTKMRQRMQKRGIARKGEDAEQPAT